MIKAGIIGANGYTGFELLRILGRHGEAKVTAAASRSNAGTPVADLYPALKSTYGDMLFCDANISLFTDCDVCFTALPHAASAEIGGILHDAGVKVIDLSADFRYDSLRLYEQTYGVNHPRPELNEKAVYGLPELFRDKIAGADIVGNPGCYTTASILALYPLIKENVIGRNGIIIDAKSGVTGAGRKADVGYSYCETADNFKAYGVTTHRHTSEIEEKLGVTLSFTPHLLPVKRGILATVYADCSLDADAVQAAYDKYYSGGYPPDSEGVCTDVIWRALKNAGYSLKDMVDADMQRLRGEFAKIYKEKMLTKEINSAANMMNAVRNNNFSRR